MTETILEAVDARGVATLTLNRRIGTTPSTTP